MSVEGTLKSSAAFSGRTFKRGNLSWGSGEFAPRGTSCLLVTVGAGRLSPSVHVLGGPLGREQLQKARWALGFEKV